MEIVNELPDIVVLNELGARFSAMRIGAQMTQEQLARRAGVSKRSIERLEKGEGGVRLQIVVSVARALRRLTGLNAFLPEAKVSPYEIVSSQVVRPKRVRVRKQPVGAFKWGE